MKRISSTQFIDHVSEDCSIEIDTMANKATVQHTDHRVSYSYSHPITMDDYETLRNNVESRLK